MRQHTRDQQIRDNILEHAALYPEPLGDALYTLANSMYFSETARKLFGATESGGEGGLYGNNPTLNADVDQLFAEMGLPRERKAAKDHKSHEPC